MILHSFVQVDGLFHLSSWSRFFFFFFFFMDIFSLENKVTKPSFDREIKPSPTAIPEIYNINTLI